MLVLAYAPAPPRIDPPAIAESPTSVAAFVGASPSTRIVRPTKVGSLAAYTALLDPAPARKSPLRPGGRVSRPAGGAIDRAVRDYFAHGGREAWIVPVVRNEVPAALATLGSVEFNLLAIPPSGTSAVPASTYRLAATLCAARRAMLLVDPPLAGRTAADARAAREGLGFDETKSGYAAFFFPALKSVPTRGVRPEPYAPSGAIAGLIARADEAGVWKWPSGEGARLVGAAPVVALPSADDALNRLGINLLRTFARGSYLWGGRMFRGDAGGEEKYVAMRRLRLHIERSIYAGTGWTRSMSSDEALWSPLRARAETFLNLLYRKGAFQGRTPREAYFVRCDRTTTSSVDNAEGRAILLIGFAPVRPSEFVVLRLALPARAA